MLCHHFQRLTVFLVHGEKEKRQHHCHHAKCGKAQIFAGFEQKENRNANQRTGSKAEKPPTLFDLTSLQREANRQLGFTADVYKRQAVMGINAGGIQFIIKIDDGFLLCLCLLYTSRCV